jgi:hypothetical protein
VSKTQTCPGQGSDMSGQRLWNPTAKPNKAEGPDMSRLGAGHDRSESLEPGC